MGLIFGDVIEKVKHSQGAVLEKVKQSRGAVLEKIKKTGNSLTQSSQQPKRDSQAPKEELKPQTDNLHQAMTDIQSPMESSQPSSFDAVPISFMVSVDGQEAGPYTILELQQFVATGEFTPQVYVWTDGMPQWELAGNVPELASLFSY